MKKERKGGHKGTCNQRECRRKHTNKIKKATEEMAAREGEREKQIKMKGREKGSNTTRIMKQTI